MRIVLDYISSCAVAFMGLNYLENFHLDSIIFNSYTFTLLTQTFEKNALTRIEPNLFRIKVYMKRNIFHSWTS